MRNNLLYPIPALLLAIIIGGKFTGCQAEPAVAQPYEQPTVEAESYFIDPEPYDPCKDPLLKFELSEEGKQRYRKCKGVTQ